MDLSVVVIRPVRAAVALAAVLLAVGGCTWTPYEAPADPARLPGVSDRVGTPAACASDLQSCANGHGCCGGLVCAPHGSFGMLCRRPAVGGGGGG